MGLTIVKEIIDLQLNLNRGDKSKNSVFMRVWGALKVDLITICVL